MVLLLPTLPAAETAAGSPTDPDSLSAVLTGKWQRPDGGYVITIKAVGPAGKLDAYYSNPMRLPFAEARASREGDTLRLFFKLEAGGYGGSTYNLIYDPAGDLLRGVYFQAVAGKKFDVIFQRVQP